VFKDSLEPTGSSPLKVISQVQQLALSACARNTGDKLWCGTCHDPHRVPVNPTAYFRSRCLSCHGTALLKIHPKPNQDCIGCHMPRRPVTDGGHTTFTDHRIRIISRATPPFPSGNRAGPDEVVPCHEPATEFGSRNLALAEIDVAERLNSTELAMKGARLLASYLTKSPVDTAAISAVGEVLFSVGDYERSALAYEEAVRAGPRVASNYLHAGVAWKAAGNYSRAIQDLQKALQLDPMIQEAYGELAGIYSETHEPDMVRQTWGRFVAVFPKSIEARIEVEKLAQR
jgi:tetratricopeptide (TPR) repeat protein